MRVNNERERERERERFYYHLQRSNMTYETKNITFHVVVKIRHQALIARRNSRGSGPEGFKVGTSFSEKDLRQIEREIEIKRSTSN